MPDWKELRESILAENSDSVLPPSVKLPILPQALSEFRKKSQDPEVDAIELSRILASDAGLSTELLKTVNSCKTGARAKVTSVKQALLILGIRTSLLHLTTSGLQQAMRSSSSKLINFQSFWNTNLERSLFAREIARLLGADGDLAFTAAMLQDFLLPIITNQMIDDYLEFTSNGERPMSLIEFERQKFNWDHAQAAAQVMYAWQFPDELVCSVFFHHAGIGILKSDELGKTAVAAVAVASMMPDALRQEQDSLQQLMDLEKEWDDFNLMQIAEAVDEEFREVSEARNHFTFLRNYQNALKRMGAVG